MLIGLSLGLLILILLILKTKIHVFIALIVFACIIGLVGGMSPAQVTASITSGFGGTLGSIGIIIGLGVMMGQIFEESGASTITAPIVSASNGNITLAALAACIGSLFFSYFNDSFYWVVNRLSGITETRKQIRIWSVSTTIVWAVGLVMLLLLDLVM